MMPIDTAVDVLNGPMAIENITKALLGEWWMMAMMNIYAHHVPSKALDLLRPYLTKNGILGWINVDSMLNRKVDMRFRVAWIAKVGASMNPGSNRVLVMERGVRVEIYDCPFAQFPINICDSHLIKDLGLSKALHTDYAPQHVQRQSQGFDHCVQIFRQPPPPDEEWENCGEILAEILPVNLPSDVVNQLGMELAADLWVSTVEACVDGSSRKMVSDELKPLMNVSGKAAGKRFSSIIEVAEGKEVGVIDLLRFYSEVMKQQLEPRTIDFRVDGLVSSCPFSTSSSTVCELFDAFVEGLCQSVDPSYRMETTKLECGECSLCHWGVTKS
jgi:hypothetical protein